jgi:hypothetical protein
MRSSLGIAVLCSVLLPSSALMAQPPPADCPSDIGAAVAAACPCDGPQQGGSWKNHGQYQRCVVHSRNALRKQGCLTPEAKKTIARCAAKSTCGKVGAVLCCADSSVGTCTDGTCSNDATIACETSADCTVGRPHVKRRAEACTHRANYYVSGTGSVCAGCEPPVACCLPTGCQVLGADYCTAQGGTSPEGSLPSCDPDPCQ